MGAGKYGRMMRRRNVAQAAFTFKTTFNGSFSFAFYYSEADLPVVDMGDGNFGTVVRSGTGNVICTVSHTYSTSAEKQVSILVADKSGVYRIGNVATNTFASKQITEMNLSGLDIEERLVISGNPLTVFVQPDSWAGAQAIDFTNCTSLTSLNLSNITSFINNTNSRIDLVGCTSLSSVTWPSSCSFGPREIRVNNTAIPTINMAGITQDNAQPCRIIAQVGVSSLTSITPPASGPVGYTITGTSISSLGYSSASVGVEIQLRDMLSTSGNFVAGTQTLSLFRTLFVNTRFTTIDLSGMSNISGSQAGQGFVIQNNISCTSLIMPTSSVATQTVSLILITGNALTGHLDLSHLRPTGIATWQITESGVTSLTLWNNANLCRRLVFSGGGFGYVDLTAHLEWDFAGTSSANSTLLNIGDMALSSANVNKYLVDAETSSSFTATAFRQLLAGGTNAAPDTTSGGFDGVAAKASLIAKNWLVTTN
jgi:hypothetical protein